MVLMDAGIDLPLPDPPPAELVPVSTLGHEDIAWLQSVPLDSISRDSNRCHLGEVKPHALNVRHTQVGNSGERGVALSLGVFGDTPNNLSQVV